MLKRKKINSVISVIVLLVMIFIISGCDNSSNKNNETNKTESTTQEHTTIKEEQTEKQTTQTITQEPTEEQTEKEVITEENEVTLPEINEEYNKEIPDITGKWKAIDGESVSSGKKFTLIEIYGASAKYGGVLEFNSDETMFVSVGVNTGKDSKGTYKVDNSGIHIAYESGKEEVFYYYDDIAPMPIIKAKLGDYYIFFERE